MEPVVGIAHITERADYIAPMQDWEAFLNAAKFMDVGIRILAQSLPEATLPLVFLCGHATECGLKALLSYSGVPADSLKKKALGHNLIELWQKATSRVNLQPSPPPAWIEQLAQVYGEPYVLRYPMGVNGVVLPTIQSMLDGTAELLSFAEKQLKA